MEKRLQNYILTNVKQIKLNLKRAKMNVIREYIKYPIKTTALSNVAQKLRKVIGLLKQQENSNYFIFTHCRKFTPLTRKYNCI